MGSRYTGELNNERSEREWERIERVHMQRREMIHAPEDNYASRCKSQWSEQYQRKDMLTALHCDMVSKFSVYTIMERRNNKQLS